MALTLTWMLPCEIFFRLFSILRVCGGLLSRIRPTTYELINLDKIRCLLFYRNPKDIIQEKFLCLFGFPLMLQ